MNHEAQHQNQQHLLRGTALVLFTGIPGILLPAQALEKFSWLVGYGQPRLDPLSLFMTADAASVSVALAVLLWAISRDVHSYQPLVRLTGWILLVSSVFLLSAGLQCPLPWWWTTAMTGGCFFVGLALLRSTPAAEKSNGSAS